MFGYSGSGGGANDGDFEGEEVSWGDWQWPPNNEWHQGDGNGETEGEETS